jgi:hypothetical protein
MTPVMFSRTASSGRPSVSSSKVTGNQTDGPWLNPDRHAARLSEVVHRGYAPLVHRPAVVPENREEVESVLPLNHHRLLPTLRPAPDSLPTGRVLSPNEHPKMPTRCRVPRLLRLRNPVDITPAGPRNRKEDKAGPLELFDVEGQEAGSAAILGTHADAHARPTGIPDLGKIPPNLHSLPCFKVRRRAASPRGAVGATMEGPSFQRAQVLFREGGPRRLSCEALSGRAPRNRGRWDRPTGARPAR